MGIASAGQTFVAGDRDNRGPLPPQQGVALARTVNFDGRMTMGVEPLDEDKIDRREPRDEVFERRMRPIADLVHERPARVGHEHDLLRACLPVDERVLARSIAERLQAHGVRRVDPPAGVEFERPVVP